MASKNTTLSAINRGGIATLADGTCSHISSSELLKTKDWRIGAEVVIQGHKLKNVETGGGPFSFARMAPVPFKASPWRPWTVSTRLEEMKNARGSAAAHDRGRIRRGAQDERLSCRRRHDGPVPWHQAVGRS
jgi:hypothetical protein